MIFKVILKYYYSTKILKLFILVNEYLFNLVILCISLYKQYLCQVTSFDLIYESDLNCTAIRKSRIFTS